MSPLTDTDRRIIRRVVQTFVDSHEPTSLKSVAREFRDLQAPDRLARSNIFSRMSNQDAFIPKILAFHYCGDSDTLHRAKTAATVVLHILQRLFDSEGEKEDFTPAELEQHAKKMFEHPPSIEVIQRGLYLVQEFNVLSGYSNPKQTDVLSIRIGMGIVGLTDIDGAWDAYVTQHSRYVENDPEPMTLDELNKRIESGSFGLPDVLVDPKPSGVVPPLKEDHPPHWPCEKTLAALRKQLAKMDSLRGRPYGEAEHDERGWKNLTLNILTRGFGPGSNNVDQFHQAKNVGEHPETAGNRQNNYDARLKAFTAMLNSTITELELMLPAADILGAYEPGHEYQFYKDLKTIVDFASEELFVCDAYLDTELFDVYMEKVEKHVNVRVLTGKVADPLKIVAGKFSKRGNFELRSSKSVHDRVVFADDRCWVIGQSIKDAARQKPTYIVEHYGSQLMRAAYEDLWKNAASVVKG